ncbi:hypothetical protein BaRGS_00030694 [Batillaria attramentaria]|uniref:Uncharacterized protein n=1 Tax=Batillaria attramentaria TaxID=370345 RepID=A0ABD0JU33_9CAEN
MQCATCSHYDGQKKGGRPAKHAKQRRPQKRLFPEDDAAAADSSCEISFSEILTSTPTKKMKDGTTEMAPPSRTSVMTSPFPKQPFEEACVGSEKTGG